MAKAFFSRKVPFYLLGPEEVNDSNGFDAYPVDIPSADIDKCQQLRATVDYMENTFLNSPAPEESAQDEATLLSTLLEEV